MDTAQVAVVTVAVYAHGNIEIHLRIGIVGLLFAHVPLNAGAAQHHAGKAFLQGALGRYHAHAHGALFPDAVVGEQAFVLVYTAGEALGKGLDKVEHGAFAAFVQLFQYFGVAVFARLIFGHKVGQITVNAAGAEIRRM